MTIYLNINDGIVENVSFQGVGCAISMASASMLTDKLKGMSVEEVKKITQEEIVSMLGVKLSVIRMKCGLLSLKTTIKALEEVK